MAFEQSKTGYSQIDPTFAPGYNPNLHKYHNIGQLQTPYQGKPFGVGGDYGPVQKTRYYTDYNRNYPYVLDPDFRAASYLPTEGQCFKYPGYFPCYESKYPEVFVPPNYFSPDLQHPSGHAQPVNKYSSRPNTGTVKAYLPERKNVKEGYSNSSEINQRPNTFRKLMVSYPGITGGKDFFPFGQNRY